MSAVLLNPDHVRQDSVAIGFVTVKTETLITARVGQSVVVITADEAEKASVDLWSAAGHAVRSTAANRQKAEMEKRVIKPRRTRKGKIPLTE